MRAFFSGSGSDSTGAVRSYLAAHRQLFIADLYLIRTAPCFAGNYLDKTFKVTNWPSSLKWDYKGTFVAGNISRGQVESKIGLEADTVQVTWTPKDTDILATDGSGNTIITALQGFPRGVFDNGTIEIWRCLMPTDGDCNTLGACLMFAGRIGNFEPDRLSAQIDVVSRIETLNVQVPTNLIEPTNILAQYLTGQIPSGGGARVGLPGTTMPWDTTVNPSYDYGIHDGTPPIIIDLASLAGYSIGATVDLACVGSVRASDARPYVGPNGQPIGTTTGSLARFPSYYMAAGPSVGLVEPVGVCTDDGGVIKGSPFPIGPFTSITIPTGATKLSIGVNDDHFADNVGEFAATITIQFSGTSSLTIIAGSTRQKLYADSSIPLTSGAIDGGYIKFASPAKLGGAFCGVRAQTIESGHFAFYLYEPLPFLPDIGDVIIPYTPIPRDFSGSIASGLGYAGFPFVPSPVNSSVIIA